VKQHNCRRSMWVMPGQRLCWCYQCGAIRRVWPKSRRWIDKKWIKPTGIGGLAPTYEKGELK